MGFKKILFIVNPISGTGKQNKLADVLFNTLNKSKFYYDIVFTEYRGHAISISRKAILNYDVIVAVGGDGTVNEVVKGVVGSNVTMGILPIGSGNGLARHLGLSMQLEEAIATLNEMHVQNIDTAIINNQVFANVAGVGFDAHVAHLFANTKKRGPMPYVKLATQEFTKYISNDYEIFIDGKDYSSKAFVISFANSSQFGNNAYISPNANIADGLIDVCILKDFPKVDAAQLAVKLFNKRLDKSKYMNIVRGKEIFVKSKNKILGHIDGEPIHFSNEIIVNVIPKSLKLVNNSQPKSADNNHLLKKVINRI